MFCGNCGTKYDNEKFCAECGGLNPEYKEPNGPSASEEIIFCGNCGSKFDDGSFCGECGASRGNEPVPNRMPNSFFRRNKKVILSVAAACVLIIIGSAVFIANSPALTVLRVSRNFESEFMRRIETTPFYAAPLLWSILENGTATVRFDYNDQRAWGLSANGDFTFMSNRQRSEYLFDGNVRAMGLISVDIEAHLNSQRLAARTRMLGNDFYGINFSTFRDDIRPFGRLVGFGNREMDMMADVVEAFAVYMDIGTMGLLQPYIDLYTEFLHNLDFSSSRVGGGVTRIETVITWRDYLNLANDMLDVFENDANFSGMLNSIAEAEGVSSGELMREIRFRLEDMYRNMRGEDTVTAMYVRRNRLERLVQIASVDGVETTLELDLGDSFDSTLVMDVSVRDRAGSMSTEIFWEMHGYEHYLDVNVRHPWGGSDRFRLSSSWTPDNGRFTVDFDNEFRLDGNFTRGRNEMALEFRDLPLGRNEMLTLNISAQSGTDIPSVSYINISDWDRVLIDAITGLFWNLIF